LFCALIATPLLMPDGGDQPREDENVEAPPAKVAKIEPTAMQLMCSRNSGMHSERSVAHGRGFTARPTDVFVTTYPKCGTTWMTQICHQIRSPGNMDFEEIFDVVPWDIMALDCGVNLDADQVGSPRVFKSHEKAGDIAKSARYIHVCRDPEDAFVSFYRFLPAWGGLAPGLVSIEEFAEAIFGGASHSGGIWDFYSQWWERRNDPNVLWVCFEDLRSDLRGQIARVAKFMGVECDDATLSIVEEKSAFKFMESRQSQFDEHVVFAKVRDQMQIPKDYVFGDVSVSKVRSGGGTIGEGKGIPPKILEMLRHRWKISIEDKIGFKSYADMRKAIAEL